ncbi:hypothetical protein Pyrfu_1392 [Pyrolobus fumarii 1A]|uniref:Transposase IS30-like HTH domain-containing protein n=1 Tax=Pyrolobus fumarii (strain DSM 11204 / 1A) TaxID=694429 RepID=G0EGV2_PYRF1|nr:helix-turn-helix domain-containing protein [Pyrolobus fumarii]AEM39250.1 hypothetical protein Pyrfu_1392 [Pyrolobus fumarii 1A]
MSVGGRSASKIDEEIVRMYTEGVPVRMIVEKLGVGYYRIYSVLRRYGVGPARRGSYKHRGRLTEMELKEIRELWMRGETIYSIAKRLGRPASTVYYALKRMGLLDNKGDGEARIGYPKG